MKDGIAEAVLGVRVRAPVQEQVVDGLVGRAKISFIFMVIVQNMTQTKIDNPFKIIIQESILSTFFLCKMKIFSIFLV